MDRVGPKADKVLETYALLDSGSTHYPQQLGEVPTFTTLGSGVTPTKTALVPIMTTDCIVTVSCGVLPAGSLPAHTQMVLGRHDHEEVLRVDSEQVRQLYKEGKRLVRAPYRPQWEVTATEPTEWWDDIDHLFPEAFSAGRSFTRTGCNDLEYPQPSTMDQDGHLAGLVAFTWSSQ